MRTFTNDTEQSKHGRGAAWHAWINGKAWQGTGMRTAWALHAMCESAFSLIIEVFLWHSVRHAHPVERLWTTDKISAETATHTTHYKARNEPAIPEIEQPQNYALDRTTFGIGQKLVSSMISLRIFFVFVCFWRDSSQWTRASSFTRFLNHTQRRITVGRTPLDAWSARRSGTSVLLGVLY